MGRILNQEACRRHYQKRKAEGRCSKCNGLVERTGKSCCDQCMWLNGLRAKERQQRNKEEGWCPRHRGVLPQEGKVHCMACIGKAKKHYQEHTEKVLQTNKKYALALKLEIFAAYGGRCNCCDERETSFLVIDHVQDDGYIERKQKNKRGSNFFRWVRKQGYPKDRYQLLCANCNMAKTFSGGCPHQKKGLF